MSFLSGLGKGLSRAFDGTNLAITQAILAGDYQSAAALRARQGELQRQLQQDSEQRDARDQQVIGAKNMGIGNDVIGAMSPQDLSWVARQRAAPSLSNSAGDAGGGEDDGGPPGLRALDAPQPAPDGMSPTYAHPPGAPPPRATFTSARFPSAGLPLFNGGAMPGGAGVQPAPFRGAPMAQLAMGSNLPRVGSDAQAVSLPRGANFIAPDGSIRRTM
jgi:hypothetical protein